MIAEAWDGTFVSKHTVDVTVGEVKKALQEFGLWDHPSPEGGLSVGCAQIGRISSERAGTSGSAALAKDLKKPLHAFDRRLRRTPEIFRPTKDWPPAT